MSTALIVIGIIVIILVGIGCYKYFIEDDKEKFLDDITDAFDEKESGED